MRLFVKVFAAFFLTVVLVGALIVLTTMTRTPEVSPSLRAAIAREGERAADAWERGGATALQSTLENLPVTSVLVEAEGRPVGTVAEPARELAAFGARIGASGERVPGFAALGDVGVQPVTSASGRHYLFLLRLPRESPWAVFRSLEQRPAVRFSIVAAVAAAICFLLARHITSPLVRLRAVVQRIAEGRLEARADSAIARRRDEVGDLARAVDRMAGQLEALVASERRLLADVSHELRSPLARLRVAVGLVRQRGGAEQEAALERIEHEVQRLDHLIGQALTLSRAESGIDAGRRERFDLADLVQEVAADGDFEARASGRRVRVARCERCEMEGSAELLRSAIENVVRNAIRFAPAGTAVEIELGRRPRGPAGEAVVSVRDQGPGIPEAMLRDVFLPFRRVEGGRPDGRSGLGLAIAERVARAHGGTIAAANAPSGGLVVTIVLPPAA